MEEVKVPEGTVFTLLVPLDRARSKTATFYLKEMDETVYMYARTMIDQKKDFDAVRMIIKELSLPGSSPVDLLKGNFIAIQSASPKIIELITPLDSELKKN